MSGMLPIRLVADPEQLLAVAGALHRQGDDLLAASPPPASSARDAVVDTAVAELLRGLRNQVRADGERVHDLAGRLASAAHWYAELERIFP